MFLVQAGSPLLFFFLLLILLLLLLLLLVLLLVLSLLSNWICHAGKAKPFRTMLCSRQCDFTAGLGTPVADK